MGPKWWPKIPNMDLESTKIEPNGDHGDAKITQKTCPGRGPRKGRKKDAPPQEQLKQLGQTWDDFLSHVAYFGVTFSMFFQGHGQFGDAAIWVGNNIGDNGISRGAITRKVMIVIFLKGS